jgi:endonuclease G
MTEATPLPDDLRPFDLIGFTSWLRTLGWRIEPGQIIAAETMMLSLAVEGKHDDGTADLSLMLQPILCTNKEEQEKFASLYDEWCQAVSGAALPSRRLSKTGGPSRQYPLGKMLSLVPLLLLFGGVSWLTFLNSPPAVTRVSLNSTATTTVVTPTESITVTPPTTIGEKPSQGPDDKGGPGSKVDPPRRDISPQRLSRLVPLGSLPQSSTGSKWWWAWSLVPLTVWALFEVIPGLWAWLRGDRLRADLGTPRDGDRDESVLLPQIVREILPSFPVRQTAATMRTRIDVPGRELDLNRTIKRTVANGGLPQIVTGSRRERSFVVLADRRHVDDHQARLASLILKGLCDLRVDVDIFWFEETPEYCFSEHKGTFQPKDLHSLLTERPEHKLLIFGNGDEFFDRFEGTKAEWIKLIQGRVGAALLTTVPVRSWTKREWLIERQFGVRVLPLNPDGFHSLGRLWSDSPVKSHVEPAIRSRRMPLYERNQQRLLERDPPPRDVIDRLFIDLQNHLDADAFHWLCCLAIYPQLQWAMTIWLGRQLFPEKYEELISQLSQLVWLREAYMPTWFRRELLDRLPSDLEIRARNELTALLMQSEPGIVASPPKGSRVDQTPEPLVAFEQFLDRLTWVRRNTNATCSAAPGTPTRTEWRDSVFVDFMSGRNGTEFGIPRWLWRLFLRPGRVLPSRMITSTAMLALTLFTGWWTYYRPSALITAVSVNRAMNAVVIKRQDETRSVASTPVRRSRMMLGKISSQAGSKLVTAHEQAVSAIAISPSGGQLISAGWDQKLKLWNLDSGTLEVESERRKGDGKIHNLIMTPDRSVLAFAGRAERWDLPSWKMVEETPFDIGQIAVSLRDSRIVTARKGEIIVLTPQFVSSQTINVSKIDLSAIAATTDSKRIVAGDNLGGLYLVDLTTGSITVDPPLAVADEKLAVYAIAIVPQLDSSPKGQIADELAVVASGDGSLRVWDLTTKKPLRTIQAHAAEASAVVGLTDGRIVSGSLDGTIKVLDPRTGEQSLHLVASGGGVASLTVSVDQKTVIAGTIGGTIELFDIGSQTSIDDSLPRLADVDATGSLLLQRDWRGRLQVWDRQSQTLRRVIPAAQSSAGFRVSPEGKWIVTWGQENAAYVWSVSGSDPPSVLSQIGIRGTEWVRDGESDCDCLLTWGRETRLVLRYPTKTGKWPAGPHENAREEFFHPTRNLSFEGTPEHMVLNTARTSAYVWGPEGTRAWLTFPGDWDRTVMSPAQGLVAGIPKTAQISKGDRWILETRGDGEGHLFEPGGKTTVTFEQKSSWSQSAIYQDNVWAFGEGSEGHLSFYDLNDVEAKKTVIAGTGDKGTPILPDRIEVRLPAKSTITGVRAVTASPHDDLLGVIDSGGSFRLYSISTGSPITDPVKSISPCTQIKFCEDQTNIDRDQLLCTVHEDESVRYWLHERVGRVHALLIDGDEQPVAEAGGNNAAPVATAQTIAQQLADGFYERFGAEASIVRRDDIDAVRLALSQSRRRVLPDDLFIVGMTGLDGSHTDNLELLPPFEQVPGKNLVAPEGEAPPAPAAEEPPAPAEKPKALLNRKITQLQYVSFLQPNGTGIPIIEKMTQTELARLLADHPCRTIFGFFEERIEEGPPAQNKLPGMTRRLMHDTVDRAGERASVPSDLRALLNSNEFQGPRQAYLEDWYESIPWPAAGHSLERDVYFPRTLPLKSIRNKPGYQPSFLKGAIVPMPVDSLEKSRRNQTLTYDHFTVVLNESRRMALYAAYNIDRDRLLNIPRGPDRWILDPRVPTESQLSESFYRNNEWDKGHLVPRRAVAWGTEEEATQAALSVFTYANTCPQYSKFNQGVWSDLEQHVLSGLHPESRKLSVFVGPVLADTDPVYRDERIPRSYWIVAFSENPKQIAPYVDAWMIPQYELLKGEIAPIKNHPRDLSVFRISVQEIEATTGLKFYKQPDP